MALRLVDRWIWDFWLASDETGHHLFYLQAPKAIGDPEQRHWNVSIGHAISDDLCNWTLLDDALTPGEPGAFDDYTVWTGSILHRGGTWLMAYTGTSRADKGMVQRVGFAVSDDLHQWRRTDTPALSADPLSYETLAHDNWHDEAWRDPWLFTDDEDDELHVLLTARRSHGERFDRGVVGHARTADLITWQQCEPIATPTGFGQMEVPQLVHLEDRWYLLFCSDIPTQSPMRQSLGTGTGTYYMVADNPYGPFEFIGDGVLEADSTGSTYAGRIHVCNGSPWFLAWNRAAADGSFIGEIGDPRRVTVQPDGSLKLAAHHRIGS